MIDKIDNRYGTGYIINGPELKSYFDSDADSLDAVNDGKIKSVLLIINDGYTQLIKFETENPSLQDIVNANPEDEDYKGAMDWVKGYEALNSTLTLAEAAKEYNLSDAAVIRKAIAENQFSVGYEVRQSGSTWLITREAAEKTYGHRITAE